MKKDKQASIFRMIFRIILGAIFIFSGFTKAVDPLGSAYKIQDYLTAFGPWAENFTPLALIMSITLSAIEFTIGINLFFSANVKISTIGVLIFMAIMLPLTLYIAIENPVSDCGCFGDAIILTNWETFAKNIIILAIALFLFFSAKKQHHSLRTKYKWTISALALCTSVAISVYSYHHLPFLDFRPYKIGTDIRQAMSIPDNAEQDEYQTIFVYEKDGKEQEFTIENYPKEGSGWTFVDQQTTLIKKGYEPPIHDFSIVDYSGEDLTEYILDYPGYSFMLIAYDVTKSNLKHTNKINKIYNFAIENEHHFYAVTASSDNDIDIYKQSTDAQYLWYKADPITLKTIIRANPGLMLIKNGKIIGKWNTCDIPETKKIKKIIEDNILK